MAKKFSVTAHIPQAVAHRAFQNTEVSVPEHLAEGRDFGVAASRAWQIIREREGVKGKKITQVRFDVQFLTDEKTA